MPTYKIQLRRDTAANFQSSDPTIAEGEVVIDTTAQQSTSNPFFKIGKGAAYTATDFAAPALVNPTGGTNNYAPIASPTFTGTTKGADVTVEDTDSNDPTLTVQTTDGSGTTVIKHDSINCSGGITGSTVNATTVTATTVSAGSLSGDVAPFLLPTGTVLPYAGASAPTGFKLCDGDDLNTFTFKELHAVISNTYGGTAYQAGVTDQSGVTTTFKLPDLRGRVPAGSDQMNSSDNELNSTGAASNLSTIGTALGTAGGAETHTLTEAQLPAHRHFLAADDFGIGAGAIAPTNSNQVNKAFSTSGVGVTNDQDYTLAGTSTEATIGRSSSVGSGSVHNNVQPTIILNYMIKH